MSDLTNMQTPSERAFLWRWIAAAFTYPDQEIWAWLKETAGLIHHGGTENTETSVASAPLWLQSDLFAAQAAHLSVFGHTVRGDCPPHEIEYGELKADWLFQPHRLADIAAFYSAFGLEVPDDADERVDHIAMECEFFSILCAKEAEALAEGSQEHSEICRGAQKQFLREHLGRWTPSFSRRLERLTNDRFLQALAAFLRASVIAECGRFGIAAGNEDIVLRPADDMVDPCGKCGIEGLKTAEAST
jgi:TorA maturation chaperone TorD